MRRITLLGALAVLTVAPFLTAPVSAQVNNPGVIKSGSSTGNDIAEWTGSGQFLTGQGHTYTTSNPATIAQTWNAGGVTFTGFLVNATKTAAAAPSYLAMLQTGGSRKLAVDTDGFITGASSFGGVDIGGVTGAAFAQIDGNGINIRNNQCFGLTSNGDGASGADTTLCRDAANTLAQRRGTNAQEFRVYESYTDASNNQGITVNFTAGIPQISQFANGTGTSKGIILKGLNGTITFGLGTNNGAWDISSLGNLVANADNTHDIGATATTLRPRNIWAGSAIVAGTVLQTVQAYSVAGTALPTCNAGAQGTRAFVSDATLPTYLAAYVSGGAVVAPVFCNGTTWLTD